MNYEIILLDLGGVVIDLNLERYYKECQKLGIINPQEFFSFSSQSDLFSQFETGKMNEIDFLSKFSALVPMETSADIIKKIWCSMIEGIRADTIETLKILKDRYKIYALSNTNTIHINYINNLLESQYKIPELSELFDGCFFSFKEAVRKPSAEYFEKFFLQKKLDMKTALFVDDLPANISAAEKVGIKSLLKPRELLLKKFLTQNEVI